MTSCVNYPEHAGALPFSFGSECHHGVSERAAPTDLVVASNKLGVCHVVTLGHQNVQ
jgi:hypothetical protein